MTLSCHMGQAFENWQTLTDEYAQALSALQRGDLSARPRVNRLAREILRLSPNSPKAVAPPVAQVGPFSDRPSRP